MRNPEMEDSQLQSWILFPIILKLLLSELFLSIFKGQKALFM